MIFISRIFDIKERREFISKKRPLDFSAADSFEGKNLQRGTAPDNWKASGADQDMEAEGAGNKGNFP